MHCRALSPARHSAFRIGQNLSAALSLSTRLVSALPNSAHPILSDTQHSVQRSRFLSDVALKLQQSQHAVAVSTCCMGPTLCRRRLR
jgi:hypothetical protein